MTPSSLPVHTPIRATTRVRRVAVPALLLVVSLLRPGEHVYAQDTTDVNPVRLAIVSGITLGTVIPVHI
jgi:hypothetical protein